ncbi:class I SAM-dependent methyltransferase [Salinispirillum marinum]|uniref:Class I SAM-dependent methyltransferase n=2 Tax=Saccharospirillaceae TaxID=255527 RepID=A0ABV8BFW6_9GAMM
MRFSTWLTALKQRWIKPVGQAKIPEQQLNAWYRTELGEALYRTECGVLAPMLSAGYHPFLVQIDGGLYRPLFDVRKTKNKVAAILARHDNRAVCPVIQSDPEHLALQASSVDMLILHHVMEYSENPHRILREAVQALRPGGQLMIMGFNPFGFWGVSRIFRRHRPMPWAGQFISANRVADWCRLLDCEPLNTQYYYHWPPMTQASWKRRVRFLNALIRNVLPIAGAGYLLVVRKNQLEMLHDHRWSPALFMKDKVMTKRRGQVTQ